MRTFSVTLVTMLIACTLAFSACGGGGTKTITTSSGDSYKVTTDKPPSDFPSDFPIYDGASYQGAVTGSQRGVSGTVATWTTNDSVDKDQRVLHGCVQGWSMALVVERQLRRQLVRLGTAEGRPELHRVCHGIG